MDLIINKKYAIDNAVAKFFYIYIKNTYSFQNHKMALNQYVESCKIKEEFFKKLFFLVQMSKLKLLSYLLISSVFKFPISVPTLSGIYSLSNYLLLSYSFIALFSNIFSYFSFIFCIYSVYLYI